MFCRCGEQVANPCRADDSGTQAPAAADTVPCASPAIHQPSRLANRRARWPDWTTGARAARHVMRARTSVRPCARPGACRGAASGRGWHGSERYAAAIQTQKIRLPVARGPDTLDRTGREGSLARERQAEACGRPAGSAATPPWRGHGRPGATLCAMPSSCAPRPSGRTAPVAARRP